MGRLLSILALTLGLMAAPVSAFAKWTRLTSDHFTFVGDAPERDIRLIAQQLEQFREVVSKVISVDTTHSPVPTVVVVFENDRSFSPFKPVFQGRPIGVAGYFVGSEDGNYIAVNAEQEADAYGIIFHEYAHFMVGSTVGDVPIWASEGLAELYQTFELTNGGRTANIGKPSRENLELLQAASTLMPVGELMAVQRDSPLYNEGDRRSLFYAESWALVHYLTFGSTSRAGQLKNYLTSVADGTPAADAFSRAFGDAAALDRELRQYVRAYQFRALRVEFEERISASRLTPARVLEDEEAAGYLGDMMARVNRADDARTYLTGILQAHPSAAKPLSALGLIELRAGNEEAAFPLLERAATLAPADATIQAAYGRALTRRADRGLADEDELYRKARTVLARALEIEPDNVSTLVTLAEVEMGSGANTARAVQLMQRVVQAAPSREEYRLVMAQAMAVNGDYKGATAYLNTLATRTVRSDVRDAARKAIVRVADAEAAARRLAASADARRNAPPPPDAPRETAEQGGFIPTLRAVEPGESRVLGTFSTVDCLRGAIVLQVDAVSGPVRLAIKGFDEVEFLSYRQDSPTSIACGVQKPAYRVLATFRTGTALAGTNTTNRAVAIELLPDGYTPQ